MEQRQGEERKAEVKTVCKKGRTGEKKEGWKGRGMNKEGSTKGRMGERVMKQRREVRKKDGGKEGWKTANKNDINE